MIRKFGRLIAVIAVISLALYLVVQNKDPVTLRLWSDTSIQASLGIISIGVFFTGILCSALVTLVYGFRAYLRERGYRAREREREYFLSQMINARSLHASGLAAEARQLWEGLVRHSPESVIARIELARSLRALGQQAEALKVLDAARLIAPDNVELLFETAEAHIAAGNKTAAIDVLALALSQQDNCRAAELARDLSEQLERLDDALRYQDIVERMRRGESDGVRERLLYKKLISQNTLDKDVAIEKLRDFVRCYRNFTPALVRLAGMEEEFGRKEEAAKLLAQAAGIAKDRELWRRAVGLWINLQKPDRALAAARSACNGARGEELRTAQLDLVELKVDLGMNGEALKDLSDLLANIERQGDSLDGKLLARSRLLRASALAAQSGQLDIERELEELRKAR